MIIIANETKGHELLVNSSLCADRKQQRLNEKIIFYIHQTNHQPINAYR